jgi:hypothetical protein
MGCSSAESFRIVLVFLVAVGVARVAFPDPEGANAAGDPEEATTECFPAE